MRTRSPRPAILRRTLAIVGATLLASGLMSVTGYAANAAPGGSGRSPIPNSAPDWIPGAQAVGAPSTASTISFRVVLGLRNQAAAESLAASVSNPKDAKYGKYLSAAQFNATFAPTDAQVASVKSFLTGTGIAVSAVASGNRWIDAKGTVAQIQAAFSTTVKTYSYHGKHLRGTPSSLSAPSSVAGLIAGVIGVSQAASLPHPDHVSTPSGATSDKAATPDSALPAPSQCSVYYNQHQQTTPLAYGKTSFPTVGCGYTPEQVRSAYGVSSAVRHHQDGSGVTVAIIDAYASPTIEADTNQLSAENGEPLLQAGQLVQTVFSPFLLQGECGGEAGWNEEETLDVQAVHAMAPGANIHYIGAADCDTGIDDAMNYVVQNHVADIVSNSYGFLGEDGLGSEVALEHSMFLQAALEGIGLYFSSGDDGDNVIDGLSHPEPDYPASDTLVTGVGGTTLEIDSHSGYLFETSWGDDVDPVNTATTPSSWTSPLPGSFLFGGGGGVSALFQEPLYQRLAVPNSLAKLNGSTAMRVVPDVATLGDPETGFLIVFGGSHVQIGGTSLSAPVFAGFQALASQHRRSAIGFANPLLYVLGLGKASFHDVTAAPPTLALATPSGRNLLTLGMDSSLTATRGYDDTTGLGTPNGPALLAGEGLG